MRDLQLDFVFTLGVGDQIKTGQRKSNDAATATETRDKDHLPLATSEGSLGLLAFGALGLMAWRKSRRAE